MRLLGAVIAITLIGWAGAVQGADEPKADAKTVKPKAPAVCESAALKAARPPVQGVKVWTNEDLARLSQGGPWATEVTAEGSTIEPEPPLAPAAVDPIVWLETQQEQALTRQGRIAAAESDVNAAMTAVAALEVQSLAAKNPFSARPKLSDQEIEYRRESGETASQRAERTQKELAAARAKLVAAQARLDRARAGAK